MAVLTINTKKLISNLEKISLFLNSKDMTWSLVTKILSGNKEALSKILNHPSIKTIHSIADSRLSNLKAVKEIKPEIVTMYIKPAPIKQVKNVIEYANISLNTSIKTIKELNKVARDKNKIHRVIIMIEMGELREGVLRDNILDFYEQVFELENIQIEGIGTNLGCMYGIEPTYDKMIQLSLYEQLIEAKFNQNLELISAGSSITLPLLNKNKVPKNVNHFRVGETLFLGMDLIHNKKFKNLSNTIFDFSAEVIEIEKKEMIPDGNITNGNIGDVMEFNSELQKQNVKHYKCIVDFGKLDVDHNHLIPKNKDIVFVGTTTDMTVFDVGKSQHSYKVGDMMHFTPDYMAVAHLMNSKYVSKKII